MFKFLRRYSRWILAVGGTLLLITFLIPFAFQGLGEMAASRGATWATVGADEESISVAKYHQLQRELEIIKNLNPGLVAPLKIDAAQHWYLLTKEAERLGLVGGTDDAFAMMGDSPTEALAMFTNQTGERSQFVLETIAKYRGVIRLVTMFRTSAHFSDRRLRAKAQRLFHVASARIVAIEARADAVDIEPSEQQIEEQFAKYSDKLPGEGERGFGYRLPDRVKLEWIAIPADSVRAAVEAGPEMNDIALRKHWRRNPRLNFPDITEGAPIPEMVRSDLALELFTKEMEEIERAAIEYLRAGTRGLAREGSYYVLPEDWESRRASLPELATTLQQDFGLELPSYHSTGDRWLSAADAAELEGIGAATTDRFGPVALSLSALIAQTKEFGKAVDAVIQQGVASPPLKGQDGSLYFFRITATDASRTAADVSEVRDLVVSDLKRLADYENLQAMLTGLEAEAETDGLLTLLVSHPRAEFFPQQSVSLASLQSLMLQMQLGMSPTAMPSALPIVGRDEEAVGAIIDHAMELSPLMSIDQLTPEQKILAVPVENKLAVLIVELLENRPLTREDFNRGVELGVMQMLLLNDELDDSAAIAEAFSVDTLTQRHNFKLAQEPTEEDAAQAGN